MPGDTECQMRPPTRGCSTNATSSCAPMCARQAIPPAAAEALKPAPPPDTIYAPATAAGRAAIAIIRLSGPAAGPALAALAGKLPPSRVARHVRLRDPENGAALDDGLALWFPAPHSV